eukprot:gnl/Chilomastix_cuspidata/4430.p1 GENE.gnl/Chilomastix_cuspidata/4430~~gnl/Chilomastix_cuspidata/4430.p1  ORF type:complete len:2805 (+),score=303.60 gnl/Chilomastix_cuspidata/4430:243-8417(+)
MSSCSRFNGIGKMPSRSKMIYPRNRKKAMGFPVPSLEPPMASYAPSFSIFPTSEHESPLVPPTGWKPHEAEISWRQLIRGGTLFRVGHTVAYRVAAAGGWRLGKTLSSIPISPGKPEDEFASALPNTVTLSPLEEKHVDVAPRFRFFETGGEVEVPLADILCPVTVMSSGEEAINGLILQPASEIKVAAALARPKDATITQIREILFPHNRPSAQLSTSGAQRFTTNLAFRAPLECLPSTEQLLMKPTKDNFRIPGRFIMNTTIDSMWRKACRFRYDEGSSKFFNFLIGSNSVCNIPAFVFRKVAKHNPETGEHSELMSLFAMFEKDLSTEPPLSKRFNPNTILATLRNISVKFLKSKSVTVPVGMFCYQVGKRIHALCKKCIAHTGPTTQFGGNNPYNRFTGEGEHLEDWINALGQPSLRNLPLACEIIKTAMRETRRQCDLGKLHLVALQPSKTFKLASDGVKILIGDKTVRKTSLTKVSRTAGGATPLHFAAINPDPEVITMFKRALGNIPQINTYSGHSPLAWCFENKEDLLENYKVIIKNQSESWFQMSPITLCIAHDHVSYLQAFQQNLPMKNKKPDYSLFTTPCVNCFQPTHLAAFLGKVNVLEFFNSIEIRMTRKSQFFSAFDNNVNQFLKKRLTQEFSDSHLTPIHFACMTGSLPAVRFLAQQARVSIMPRTFNKLTPLHIACAFGKKSVVSYLLHHGAPYDVFDSQNRSPLQHAAINGHYQIVKYLLECGADSTTKDVHGMTALWNSIINNHWDISELFLNEGKCGIAEQDINGNTIINYLLSQKNGFEYDQFLSTKIIHLIEKYKCPVDIRNNSGNTILSNFLAKTTPRDFIQPSSIMSRNSVIQNQNNRKFNMLIVQNRIEVLKAIVEAKNGSTCFFGRREIKKKLEQKDINDSVSASLPIAYHSALWDMLNYSLFDHDDMILCLLNFGILDEFRVEIQNWIDEGSSDGGFYANELAMILGKIFEDTKSFESYALTQLAEKIINLLEELGVIQHLSIRGFPILHTFVVNTFPNIYNNVRLTSNPNPPFQNFSNNMMGHSFQNVNNYASLNNRQSSFGIMSAPKSVMMFGLGETGAAGPATEFGFGETGAAGPAMQSSIVETSNVTLDVQQKKQGIDSGIANEIQQLMKVENLFQKQYQVSSSSFSSFSQNTQETKQIMELVYSIPDQRTISLRILDTLVKKLWNSRIQFVQAPSIEPLKTEINDAHVFSAVPIPDMSAVINDVISGKPESKKLPQIPLTDGFTILHLLANSPPNDFSDIIGARVIEEAKKHREDWQDFINARSTNGYSAFGLALVKGNMPFADFMLKLPELDCLVETQEPTKFSILETLVSSNRFDVIASIISSFSDTHLISLMRFADKKGNTVFHHIAGACESNMSPLNQLSQLNAKAPGFIEEMMNVENKYKVTPIHLLFFSMSQKSFNDTIPDFVESADLTRKDVFGRTPLHYLFATSPNDPQLKQALKLEKTNFIKRAISHIRKDGYDPALVVSVLISICGKKNVSNAVALKDRWGATPLHYAAMRGSATSTTILTKLCPALLEEPDIDGNTPFALAISLDNKDVALALSQIGSSVDTVIYSKQNHPVSSRPERGPGHPVDAAPLTVIDENVLKSKASNPHKLPRVTALAGTFMGKHEGLSLLLSTSLPKKEAISAAVQFANIAFVIFLLKGESMDLSGPVPSAGECGWHLSHFLFSSLGSLQTAFEQIANEFSARSVDFFAKTSDGELPLHLVDSQHWGRAYNWLVSAFGKEKVDESLKDKDAFGVTPVHVLFFNCLNGVTPVDLPMQQHMELSQKYSETLSWLPRLPVDSIPEHQRLRLWEMPYDKSDMFSTLRFMNKEFRNVAANKISDGSTTITFYFPPEAFFMQNMLELMFSDENIDLSHFDLGSPSFASTTPVKNDVLCAVPPTCVHVPSHELQFSLICYAITNGSNRVVANFLLIAIATGSLSLLLGERNSRGETPLFIAFKQKNYGAISLILLSMKHTGLSISPNVTDNQGLAFVDMALGLLECELTLPQDTYHLDILFSMDKEGMFSEPLSFGELDDPSSTASRILSIGGNHLYALISRGYIPAEAPAHFCDAQTAHVRACASKLAVPKQLSSEVSGAALKFLKRQATHLAAHIKLQEKLKKTMRQDSTKTYKMRIGGKKVPFYAYGIKSIVSIAASGCQNSFYEMTLLRNAVTGMFIVSIKWGQLDNTYGSSTGYKFTDINKAIQRWNKIFLEKFGYHWFDVADDIARIEGSPVNGKFRYINTRVTEDNMLPTHPNVRRHALDSVRHVFNAVICISNQVYPSRSKVPMCTANNSFGSIHATSAATEGFVDEERDKIFAEMSRRMWRSLGVEPSVLPIETQVLVAQLAESTVSPQRNFSMEHAARHSFSRSESFGSVFHPLENITSERLREARALLAKIKEKIPEFLKLSERFMKAEKKEDQAACQEALEASSSRIAYLSALYYMAAPDATQAASRVMFVSSLNVVEAQEFRLNILSRSHYISKMLFAAAELMLQHGANPLDTLYDAIACRIHPVAPMLPRLKPNPEFEFVRTWAAHSGRSLSQLFRLEHPDACDFDPSGTRMLLFHAPLHGEVFSTLHEGLQPCGKGAAEAHQLLGQSITGSDTPSSAGIVYIAEFSFERPFETHSHRAYRCKAPDGGAPEGHDATICYGQRIISEAQFLALEGQALVPAARRVPNPVATKARLVKDATEYAVYTARRCRLRYAAVLE